MKLDIHTGEEAIQRRWSEKAQAKGDALSLCTDGLLFRGPISFIDGFWHRVKGEEHTQWQNATRRLLILTKDLNDEEGWDIRQETGRYNEIAFSYEEAMVFYKNIRMWSYLLLTGTPDNMPSFKTARNMNISGPFYETAPIARVNCKKQVGGSSISDAALKRYIDEYADCITEQIKLYDANIILCCGYSNEKNIILNFIRSQYLTDLMPIPGTGDWIYYSPSTNKIAVNSYHPSNRIGFEDTYYNLAEGFEAALEYIKKNYNKVF